MRALSPQFSHAPSLLRVNKNQARGEDLGTYLAPLTLALTFVQPEHILHVAQRNSWQKRTVFLEHTFVTISINKCKAQTH